MDKFQLRARLYLIVLLLIFASITYVMLLRPLIFTSFTTTTHYLDSLKASAKLTGFFFFLFSFVLIGVGSYLIVS
ncbi:hypothetical protein TOT_030000716 [Theileria orientalis strain Shintoku]|uniref:Uncharacterized protein n=1 Tax=Theileria orientalis strain Shintoku TaxID=869250 RepID=J4D9L3_THEOR|nr:hypothetical protein TOT_030000716 [Theileria orientalis strain Shintoku]PVC53786.1 hypothetical protein MACL_00003499 [Theileria orientalis]BAM41455.1 hypothetical protein TOT_030000716 [Theileria orientalis strain Shintoku]|eukprot:XP_009691756.1 hypothetical protein TOT_030000716 [Theileria orientalis strain Shintoku]